jgi:hypothetical protein
MPRATVLGAFAEGWRRTIGAPAVSASVLAATVLLAQPLAAALRGALETSSGVSFILRASEEPGIAAERARELGRMIDSELGLLASPAATSDWLRHDPLNPAIAGPALAYVALWLFLSGGILDRLARARPIGTPAFFAACGVFFVRFLRLAVFTSAAYFVVFRWLYPFLFVDLFALLMGDVGGERRELWVRGLLYLVFAFVLLAVNAVSDFARVRAVVEDRRGMIGALAASIRFVRRRMRRVLALYLLNILTVVVILRLWVQARPSPDAPPAVALLLVLLYLLGRLWAKLAFFASEVVFFQGELAHADYTATPLPIWPDSPEAEAMENLKAVGGPRP